MSVLDGLGMLVKWALNTVVSFFEGRVISGTAVAMQPRSLFCME